MDRTTRLLLALALSLAALVLAVPYVQRAGKKRVAVPPPPAPSEHVTYVADLLPLRHAQDGSVDYRAVVQEAIDRSPGGTVVLPDFPLLVGRAGQSPWCVRVPHGMTLRGSPRSVLVAAQAGVQIVRVEGASGVRLEGFALRGTGGAGKDLAHGLLQVSGGSDVAVVDVCVRNADADGIAVANVAGARIEGCRVEGASKAAIYVSGSRDALVANNVVVGFGGHELSSGIVVGAGIQISSNADLVCEANLVRDGIGIGILCNALSGGAKPARNTIEGNRVADVANPTSMDVSGGIRCANGNADKATQTVIASNAVRGCGAYGIYVENHGGALVHGNSVVASERAGIVVGTIEGALVADNVVWNSGTSAAGFAASIVLVNDARGVVTRGNEVGENALFPASFGTVGTVDLAQNGENSLEPRVRWADAAPKVGAAQLGELVLNAMPAPGEPIGWTCVKPGSPGTWSAFGPVQ